MGADRVSNIKGGTWGRLGDGKRAMELYQKGFSYEAVADAFGVCRDTVLDFFKRRGFERRGGGAPKGPRHDNLILAYIPFALTEVGRILRLYPSARREGYEDLRDVAFLALVKAGRSFRVSRGVPFRAGRESVFAAHFPTT